MEQMGISKFKAKCLAVLERVRKTRRSLLITRFGEPMADVVPPSAPPATAGLDRVDALHRPDRRRHRAPSQRRSGLGGASTLKLLLGTHIWVWSLMDPGHLTGRVMKALQASGEVARESRLVDLAHEDPVDRFLVATAKVLDRTLITADERLLRSRACPVLANR